MSAGGVSTQVFIHSNYDVPGDSLVSRSSTTSSGPSPYDNGDYHGGSDDATSSLQRRASNASTVSNYSDCSTIPASSSFAQGVAGDNEPQYDNPISGVGQNRNGDWCVYNNGSVHKKLSVRFNMSRNDYEND